VPLTPPTVIVTGASSGIGLHAARAISRRGWHIVMACRDLIKAAAAAERLGIPTGRVTALTLDLAAQASVRRFVAAFRSTGLPLNALVCNAAVYLPRLKEPQRSAEGYEISVATNHLGHFLLCQLLLADLRESVGRTPRLVTIATEAANAEESGPRIPSRARADLGALQGLEAGFKAPIAMVDGKAFDAAKAYRDSKLCNLLMSREFHRREHARSGVSFSTLYPGCVPDTALHREASAWWRVTDRWIQRHLTRTLVTEAQAGERVADVVSERAFARSGVHWSWGRRPREGRRAFAQALSAEAIEEQRAARLWELSLDLVELR
jgi:protochlorophyllide reductase